MQSSICNNNNTVKETVEYASNVFSGMAALVQ